VEGGSREVPLPDVGGRRRGFGCGVAHFERRGIVNGWLKCSSLLLLEHDVPR